MKKPDLRIRSWIGKRINIVVEIDYSCAISIVGKLYRSANGQYGLDTGNGSQYCFFDARNVAYLLTKGTKDRPPVFSLKNLTWSQPVYQ